MTEPARLTIILDPISREAVEDIMKRHGDDSHTQAVKRSVALQKAVDDALENNPEKVIYIPMTGSNEPGDLLKMTLP